MADRQSKLTSIFETVGDFVVTDDAHDAAEEQMGKRTARSQRRDRSQRAPVTTDYNKWKSNTDHWDFPGVDTPRQDPRVKPKDLKQADKPRTTDPKSGEASRPRDPLTSEKRDRATFKARASARDLTLTTEEAMKGQHSNDPQAIGGFMYNAHEEAPRETDRPDQEQVPPDIQRGETPAESAQDDLGFFFEEKDLAGEVAPKEFKRKVRSKKRELSGLADNFAAAGIVADELKND